MSFWHPVGTGKYPVPLSGLFFHRFSGRFSPPLPWSRVLSVVDRAMVPPCCSRSSRLKKRYAEIPFPPLRSHSHATLRCFPTLARSGSAMRRALMSPRTASSIVSSGPVRLFFFYCFRLQRGRYLLIGPAPIQFSAPAGQNECVKGPSSSSLAARPGQRCFSFRLCDRRPLLH